MEKTVMTRLNILGSAAVVNAMRSILALGLLTTLCGSAGAATVHHFRAHHPHHVTSGYAHSFAYEPARPPVHDYAPGTNEAPGYNEAPSDHEATTYGGVTLLPDD
jgi:hypothetical protein